MIEDVLKLNWDKIKTIKKELKDSLCLMPWLHLHVDTGGKVKACCNTSITYGSVRNQTVKEIWNGEKINTFRARLLQGEKDKRCAICYNKEAAGKSSIRTETLEKYKSIIPSVLKNEKKLKPIYLDIRFSNICNLKCRTCWHGASSSWFEDAKVLKTNFGNKAIIKATTNNQSLIEDIISYSETIEEVYFAGGEPLLMEEHYALLDELLEKKATNTLIRYNTNLSQLKLKNNSALAYWKQFEFVHLSVSIDEVEEQVELIRKGLKWKTFIDNLVIVKKECPHVKIEIAPTVSVFNVFTLAKVHQYFYNNKYIASVNDIYLNLLERPNYYNIQILPEDKKGIVKTILQNHVIWLKEHNGSEELIKEYNSIIKYLYLLNDEKGYSQYQKEVKKLNLLRNELLEIE